MVVVLLTDLLVGVAVGFSLTMISHIANGVLLNSLFQPFLEVQEVDENTNRMVAQSCCQTEQPTDFLVQFSSVPNPANLTRQTR